ncbi:MAG: type I restriction endonuclease subunit R [Candidatus Nanoarchaeia archaeon]
MKFNEDSLEQAVLELFKSLKYEYLFGPDLINEREQNHANIILTNRLKAQLKQININKTQKQIDEAVKKIQAITHPVLEEANLEFHNYILNGVDTYNEKTQKYEKVFLFDKHNIHNNNFLATNQLTIIQDQNQKRLDIVVYLNGIPLSIIELKNPSDEKTTIESAYEQIKTYQRRIPNIFTYNTFLVISDGFEARAGTITAEFDRFVQWKSEDGKRHNKSFVQIETQINGMYKKEHFLDIIHNFITIQKNKQKQTIKILASYHQYFAVNKAIEKSHQAVTTNSNRVGVIWHSTGSGKSFSMTFYTGKLINEFNNPTIIVLTDRNDLDDQLFSTFSGSVDILKQVPDQAKNREHLKELLQHRESGGIIFTTIQKFLLEKEKVKADELSNRKNIFIIADEAHRSQYDFIKGYARHMRDSLPNAQFIGFTGTPLELDGKNTSEVFGDYIDKYTMAQSVEDKTTVPIYYESRLAKIGLEEQYLTQLDSEFEEITENDEAKSNQAKRKWAQLEAIVGNKNRLELIAKDFLQHFKSRKSNFKSKAMFVCMSREICVDFYNILKALQPDLHDDDDSKGKMKIIFSGASSDKQKLQDHIRSKKEQDAIAQRFKDEEDELEIVIVRDMWLTGFDVPCVSTMYIDKPIKGHNLIQAISRVNRVFKDKDSGLVVDYIGIGQFLKQAVSFYSDSDKEVIGKEISHAIDVMKDKFEIVSSLFKHFNYEDFKDESVEYFKRIRLIEDGMEHILSQGEKKKELFMKTTFELIKAHSLCPQSQEARDLVLDIKYFQAVRISLLKLNAREHKTTEVNYNTKLNELLNNAITGKEVVDIYQIAGIDKPELSVLSDDFLDELKNKEHKNLTFELLKKLINDEIKTKSKHNKAMELKFSEILKNTVLKYENRTIETAKVIEEMINLAKHFKEQFNRRNSMGLSDDEIAFYDALSYKDEIKDVMGEDVLKEIAKELVIQIRKNKTIDWDKREFARAKMRVMIKRLLTKYKYPPEDQKDAIDIVLAQVKETTDNFEIENEIQNPIDEIKSYSYPSNSSLPTMAEDSKKLNKNKRE